VVWSSLVLNRFVRRRGTSCLHPLSISYGKEWGAGFYMVTQRFMLLPWYGPAISQGLGVFAWFSESRHPMRSKKEGGGSH
jgi:hypothetical protein